MRNRTVNFGARNSFCAVHSFVGVMATRWIAHDEVNEQFLQDFNNVYGTKFNHTEFKEVLKKYKGSWGILLAPVVVRSLNLQKDQNNFFGDDEYISISKHYKVNIAIWDGQSGAILKYNGFIKDNKDNPQVKEWFGQKFGTDEKVLAFIDRAMTNNTPKGVTKEGHQANIERVKKEYIAGKGDIKDIYDLSMFFKEKVAGTTDLGNQRTANRLDGKYNVAYKKGYISPLTKSLFDLMSGPDKPKKSQFVKIPGFDDYTGHLFNSNVTSYFKYYDREVIINGLSTSLEGVGGGANKAELMVKSLTESFEKQNIGVNEGKSSEDIKNIITEFLELGGGLDGKDESVIKTRLQYLVDYIMLGKKNFGELNSDNVDVAQGDFVKGMMQRLPESDVLSLGKEYKLINKEGAHFEAMLTEEENIALEAITDNETLGQEESQSDKFSTAREGGEASLTDKGLKEIFNLNLALTLNDEIDIVNGELANYSLELKGDSGTDRTRRYSDPTPRSSRKTRASVRRHSEGSRSSANQGRENQAVVADGGPSSTASSTDSSTYVFREIRGITYINIEQKGKPEFRMQMNNRANKLMAKAAQQYFHTNPGSSIKLTNVANPEKVCKAILELPEAIGPIEFDEKTVNRLQAEGSLDKVNKLVSDINKKHQSSLTAVSQQSSAIAVVGEGSVSIPGPIDLSSRVKVNTSSSSRGGSDDPSKPKNKRRHSSP